MDILFNLPGFMWWLPCRSFLLVNAFFCSSFLLTGISLGGQPIIGYNMGAGNIDCVKETIQLITRLVLLIGTVAFLIFELVPDVIIPLFGNRNTPEYMEYARMCIRIFLGGIIMTSYIKSAAIILQSMGNSVKSTLPALLRDVIIFVPVSIALALLSGSIVTMLWAALISDVIASSIGFMFVRREIRNHESWFSVGAIADNS